MGKLFKIGSQTVYPVDWNKPIEWDDETPCRVIKQPFKTSEDGEQFVIVENLPPHVHYELRDQSNCTVRMDMPCPGNIEVNPHLGTCFVRNRPKIDPNQEVEWSDGEMGDRTSVSIHADGHVTYQVTRYGCDPIEVDEYGEILIGFTSKELFLRNKSESVRAAQRIKAKRQWSKEADEDWQEEQKSLQNNPLFGSF